MLTLNAFAQTTLLKANRGSFNERAELFKSLSLFSVPLVPHCRPRAPSSPAVVAAVIPAERDDEDDEDDDDDEEEGDDHVGHHGRALGCNSIDI